MENEEKKSGRWDEVKAYLIYLVVFLVIMGIIWLFIRPSFNHWRIESQLDPIQISYYQDGGTESSWFSDGYDYYVRVGYRGGDYHVNVSESVYTGASTPVFYYDAANDEVFEKGTGHMKVTIYFLVFAVVFVGVFIVMPIRSALNARRMKKLKELERQFGVTPVEQQPTLEP